MAFRDASLRCNDISLQVFETFRSFNGWRRTAAFYGSPGPSSSSARGWSYLAGAHWASIALQVALDAWQEARFVDGQIDVLGFIHDRTTKLGHEFVVDETRFGSAHQAAGEIARVLQDLLSDWRDPDDIPHVVAQETAIEVKTFAKYSDLSNSINIEFGAVYSSIGSSADGNGELAGESSQPSSALIVTAKHSEGFRSVEWFGKSFSFTANQGRCVQLLWNAWERGTPDLSEKFILSEVEVSSQRLRDVFKSKGVLHEAWNTFIQKGETKGTFRVVEPKNRPGPHEILHEAPI
ncbi:MAG: hypothetical protein JNM18_12695 [Planctomycetaceae bacterium]|nr:hypothetical protein [Planctomycetaceae bacterium]